MVHNSREVLKVAKFVRTEIRKVAARAGGGGNGESASKGKMKKFWRQMVTLGVQQRDCTESAALGT